MESRRKMKQEEMISKSGSRLQRRLQRNWYGRRTRVNKIGRCTCTRNDSKPLRRPQMMGKAREEEESYYTASFYFLLPKHISITN